MDPSPSQQLAMIAAWNTMLAETRALFAAPPAGLSAEQDGQEPKQPQTAAPPPEATAVRAAPRCNHPALLTRYNCRHPFVSRLQHREWP